MCLYNVCIHRKFLKNLMENKLAKIPVFQRPLVLQFFMRCRKAYIVNITYNPSVIDHLNINSNN